MEVTNYSIIFELEENNQVIWHYDSVELRPSLHVLTTGLNASRFISCTSNGSIISSDKVINVFFDEETRHV